MSPLVSIIIPNYNHKKYLEERIQSILNQTFQDFEIIILDDCSTDSSYVVIEKYRNNPKVSQIVYNTINSGSTFIQWNKGFSLAKGEFIWIAESDDFCDYTLLDTLVEKLRENNKRTIAFSLSQFVDSKGNKIPPILKTSNNKSYQGSRFISYYMTFGNSINNASSAIFRKDALSYIKPDYMNYKAVGDKLFWIEIAQLGDVAIINKPLNYFRQHIQKVSPTKLIDGTTFREEYKIFEYLISKHFINRFDSFFIRNYYYLLATKTNFCNTDVKQEILKLWNNQISSIVIAKTLEFMHKIIRKLRTSIF